MVTQPEPMEFTALRTEDFDRSLGAWLDALGLGVDLEDSDHRFTVAVDAEGFSFRLPERIPDLADDGVVRVPWPTIDSVRADVVLRDDRRLRDLLTDLFATSILGSLYLLVSEGTGREVRRRRAAYGLSVVAVAIVTAPGASPVDLRFTLEDGQFARGQRGVAYQAARRRPRGLQHRPAESRAAE